MTDNDDKLINAARAFVGLTVEVAEVRTILLRALDALAREPRREAALTQTVAGLNAAEARERRVREWMDEMPLADSRRLRAILDGESTPVEAPPTITLDALKMGTIAEEAGEQCPRCHGSGRRIVDQDEAACPRCCGTGKVTP